MTMATEAGLRTPVACELVGVSFKQADYWCRTDLVRPSVFDAAGSGARRLYSEKDLVLLAVVKGLLDGGVSLQRCRQVVDAVRQAIAVGPDEDYWVVLGEQVEVTPDLRAAVRRQRGVFGVLDLAAVISTVIELVEWQKVQQVLAESAD